MEEVIKTIGELVKDFTESLPGLEVLKYVSVIIVFLQAIYKGYKRYTENRRFNSLGLSGLFLSKRKSAVKDLSLVELVRFQFGTFFTKPNGSPIYIFDDQDYKFKFVISDEHPNVINGSWKSIKDPKNYGLLSWNYDYSNLDGFWSAATRAGKIEYGSWKLYKLEGIESELIHRKLKLGFRAKLRELKEKFFEGKKVVGKTPPDLYDNIIKKHQETPSTTFRFNGRDYQIREKVFNPAFGKIGRPMIEYVLMNYDFKNFTNLADWGTGCGYYAIEMALKLRDVNNSKAKVVAIDNDESAFACASFNLAAHGIGSHEVELISGRRISDTHRTFKFDLIMANLPFGRQENLSKYKEHQMYNTFCATPEMIFNYCFEFKNFLSEDGRAIISFGDSGDFKWLTMCCSLVKLDINELFTIDKAQGATDDIFYAYEITHSKKG